jgi:hypothetical protein
MRWESIFLQKAIYIEGYHIHHFYWGTLALALGGILGILTQKKNNIRLACALMGIGIGLFADEIGLLLNCTTDNRVCSYFFPDTSDFIYAIAVVIIFFIVLADSNWPDYIKNKSRLKKPNNFKNPE